MEGICHKLEHGHGTAEDVAKLEQVANSIAGNTICALGDAAAMPVQSFVKKFKARVPAARRAAPLPVSATTAGGSPRRRATRWPGP